MLKAFNTVYCHFGVEQRLKNIKKKDIFKIPLYFKNYALGFFHEITQDYKYKLICIKLF